ncbi:MAG TPA: glycosyltransferase family 2 protein [Friedmanniella sp.]
MRTVTVDAPSARDAALEPGLRFSVVIPNYNYGHFIGAAVRSALALDWPSVEVIVVDDGSTDDSLDVLDSFGDRITVLQQENSGPRVACNRGFAVSHGDCVVFLDSDDQVDPSLAREVAGVWRHGVSKVQVEMRRVDSRGRELGSIFPDLDATPTPQQIRRWMVQTGAYPTPPGSGNVYSRDFLERLFPLDDSCGDATDSACLAAAPLLGEVVTVSKPLVSYRVHDDNRSKLTDAARFTKQIERAVQRHRFALRVSGRTTDEKHLVRTLRRGRHLLQLRIAERRLAPGGPAPVPGDSLPRLVGDVALSIFSPGPEPVGRRIAILGWSVATLVAPAPVARRLIERRFNPQRSTVDPVKHA